MTIRRAPHGWESWVVPVCFISFSVLNTKTALTSLNHLSNGAALALLNTEFAIAGILLVVGVARNSAKMRQVGHLMGAAGLAVVGAAILMVAGLRGAPVSSLLFGFALREIALVRSEAREEREFAALLRIASEEDGDGSR